MISVKVEVNAKATDKAVTNRKYRAIFFKVVVHEFGVIVLKMLSLHY